MELLRPTTGSVLCQSKRWKTTNSKKAKAPPVENENAKPWEPKKKQIVIETKQKLDPEFLNKKVLDDVWIREYYPPKAFTLAAAVQMHSELASEEMTNNVTGLVYLDLTLDLTTKKKTKFIKNIGNMVSLPHYFQHGKQRRIMVLSQSEENVQKAKELGAVIYGGDDLIKMIDNGVVLKDEFDYVIATTDMMKPINKLKYFFKDRLPQKNTGNFTDDVEGAYRLFEKGVAYALQATTDEAVGRLKFSLGPLNLSEGALLDNATAFIENLCKYRPQELGPFITSAVCTCPPSREAFDVDLTEYLPAYSGTKSAPADDDDGDIDQMEASE